MPVWDAITQNAAILPISAFDETKGIYLDGKDMLPQIGTSNVREDREGIFKNGFYTQATNVYWGDSQHQSHAAINNEHQFYRNPYGNDPSPLANYSVNGNNMRMGARRATAAEQSTFAHYKGYHIMPDGRQATIADLPNPNPAWFPIRENRGGGDNQDVWRFEKYPANHISTMLSTIGRLEMSFGRVLLRGTCASGGQLNGATFKDYQKIESYFAALIWALEAIGYAEDINGEPLTGAATHMPANEAASGVIPEVDGHENFSDSHSQAHHTVHYFANGAQQQTPSSIIQTADARTTFIEYGWDLTPGKIGFHINGVYTNVLTTPVAIANPKPIYVKDPNNDARPNLVNGLAQTAGTRTHADGSDFYMRWFFLSNLAVSSNLSKGSFYDHNTNNDLTANTGAWTDTAFNEIEYIMIRPLAVDNPDQNGIRLQGVVDGTDNTGTPSVTTTTNTTNYLSRSDVTILLPPYGIKSSSFEVTVAVPTGKTFADYTYNWMDNSAVRVVGDRTSHTVTYEFTGALLPLQEIIRLIDLEWNEI